MKPCFILLLAACIAVSCTKEKKENANVPKVSAVKLNGAVADYAIANPANPYDDAGLLHNRALTFALNRQTAIRDSSLTTIENIMKPYAADSLGKPLPGNIIQVATRLLNDGPDSFRHVIAGSGLSPVGQYYLRRLLKIGTDTTAIIYGSNGSRMDTLLIALEKRIIADISVPETDRVALLQAASVARYSVAYWLHDNHSDQPSSLSIFKKLWVSAHDVLGTALLGLSGGAYLSDAARAFITKDYKFFVPDFED
ncbi:hypothetical protein MUY27_00270 [Mucilaginibacter sp. RS28]|uniref:Uncharacterized protein n=1 Tax=Mucilaginibacter straminoryzae TaxID=2932774 RepID=A0A9X1WYZ2_9SPHI|nr:hypothetical protein [Mucilaginibacter straminoryzae]MCJ8208119.1 hypothetical protein [Mucilaginibacter straminoryzae]